MDENEFILMDRIQKIQQIINKYGEDNFYLSFSGGKDSTVLHYLLDEALPNNKIPRVFFNTGIEYKLLVQYVERMALHDSRIVMIKPSVSIKNMLENEGYPFKSKEHSKRVCEYQTKKEHTKSTYDYANRLNHCNGRYGCPQILQYQFSPEFQLKISDKCCQRLKKDIGFKWAKENNKSWVITGIMKAEGGVRTRSACVVEKKSILIRCSLLVKNGLIGLLTIEI